MEKGNKKLHFLDRYLGIPLIFSLGIFSRKIPLKKIKNIDIKKIGILNPASIGDTVLIFGIIEDLKKKYPKCEIVFFAGNSNYEITLMCRFIDRIVKLNVKSPIESIRKIREAGNFDLFIDCQPWPRFNALMSFFAKSRIKIGFKTAGQYRHYVYNVAVEHSGEIHELQNLRNLVRPMGIDTFSFPLLEPTRAKEKRKIACLHLYPSGMKSYLKKWTNSKWAEVIYYLQGKGYQIYITGGKADKNDALEFISKFALKGVNNTAGHATLEETINLLSSAELVISVNTGVLHLASCLRANLIGLHGPTSAKRWGPVNENSVAIQSTHPDAPCLNLGSEYACRNDRCNCMEMITVEEVISAINYLEN